MTLIKLGIEYKADVLDEWRERDEVERRCWRELVESNKFDLKRKARDFIEYVRHYVSGEFGEPTYEDKRAFLFGAVKGDFHACKTYHLKFGEVEGALDCQNELDGKTALAIAAGNEDLPLVKFLLKHDADPMVRDRFGAVALHYGAASYEMEIAERLLLAGTDVDVRDRLGITPLMRAAEAGDPDMIDLLIEYAAAPNKRDKAERWTALHYAAKGGDEDAVKTLLKSGCDFTKASSTEQTAQDVALDHDQKDAAMMLVKWRRHKLLHPDSDGIAGIAGMDDF